MTDDRPVDPNPPAHLVRAAKAMELILRDKYPQYTWVCEVLERDPADRSAAEDPRR
jgi:hypothetical protein